MQKYKILTLGCKVNQYESEAISEFLNASDWTPASKNEEADVCIINTCTVTRKAAMQSRQLTRQAIKFNPHARIIVTGCHAQTGYEELKEIEGVHEIIGHSLKHRIPKAVLSSTRMPEPGRPRILIRDIKKERFLKEIPVMAAGSRTRPSLKIQDGCDAFCTYCIVPFTRGPSRSMPMEDVVLKIDTLKKAGYREVVLTGIHLGAYGNDLSPDNGQLSDLLKRLIQAGTVDRIRLSSIEPNELNNDIISITASSERICRHFHIPLQSGSDNILKKMKRPYTSGVFRDLIFSLHNAIPDVAIGCDILVGFPGETEKDFTATYQLIEALPVAYLHIFPFSAREGTKAYDFPYKVAPEIIKERCSRIRELGLLKKRLFYEKFLGQTTRILIEAKRDMDTGLLKGLTSNYITVLIDGPDYLKNIMVDVRLVEMLDGEAIFGEINQ